MSEKSYRPFGPRLAFVKNPPLSETRIINIEATEYGIYGTTVRPVNTQVEVETKDQFFKGCEAAHQLGLAASSYGGLFL